MVRQATRQLTTTALLAACAFGVGCQWAKDQARWREDFAAFEDEDRASPPRPGGVLFVGSSSIKGWDVAAAFPDVSGINRGLGRSQIRDVTRLAERLIVPYAPNLLVLYAGDNDVWNGLDADAVHRDFVDFVGVVRQHFPDCRIVFVSIKPSPARWRSFETMQAANSLIRRTCSADALLSFADVATPMIGADGRPRPELYGADGLHLTEAGYRVWNEVLTPFVIGDAD